MNLNIEDAFRGRKKNRKEKDLNLRKLGKKITILVSLIILNFSMLFQCVKAIEIQSTNIKSGGDCGSLLTYKGMVVKVYYAEYENQGKLFPAYCLDKTKQGVTDDLSYSVNIQEAISDVGLWRYIIHGYPYRTIQELGCANKEEAFTATKQAIYCYIHGNNPEDYKAIGEAGQRTLNALKKIVADAKNSKQTQISNFITIKREQGEFVQDDIDPEFVSKIYQVEAGGNISNYQISIEKDSGELIEGIKITDLKGKTKVVFEAKEKFKVMIPIKNMKEKGSFSLKVKSKIETKPVLYGKANNSSYQDYALTAATYEDSTGKIEEEYTKNETKLKIIKQDKKENKKLKGVEFNLYNSKNELIYTNLKTDEKGEILVLNLIPGTYYLKEIHTLDGYIPYQEKIEIKIDYHQTVTVTVNNSKQEKTEIKIEEKEMEVEQEAIKNITVEQEKQIQKNRIKKLPVTGM